MNYLKDLMTDAFLGFDFLQKSKEIIEIFVKISILGFFFFFLQQEGWWSYEFCYNKRLRQIHVEDDKVWIKMDTF